MSDQDQSQSGNQSQASPDSHTGASGESSPPKPQALESTPKPEPSFGIEKFSETYPNLETGIEPLPKPDSSFETNFRNKFSKTIEKRNEPE